MKKILACRNKKRRTIITTVVAIELFAVVLGTLGMYSSQNLVAQTLSDISLSSYEGQAANFLQKRNVINGFSDGTFRGSDPVNRAQAAKMLLLAANYTLTNLPNTGEFPDIEKKSWYEQFSLNAVQHGLMNGYPDGTFGPAKTVLRSEFLKMLSNAFQVEKGRPYHYVDVSEDTWFAQYSGSAEKFNLFLYDKAQLMPAAPMSREEVSWAIYQMLIFQSKNLVVRTPFDFEHTTQPRVPTTHVALFPAAPPEQSSSSSFSSPTVSSVQNLQVQQMCTDSDQTIDFPTGMNEYKKGTAKNLLMDGPYNVYNDVCIGGSNVLYEYYCNNQGYLTRERINCRFSCSNGACSLKDLDVPDEIDPRRPTGTLSSSTSSQSSSSVESQAITCTDTDSTHRFQFGQNFFAKGTVNGLMSNSTRTTYTDVCRSSTVLREFFCQQDGYITEIDSNCALGCNDSACISPGEIGYCSDDDASATFPGGKNFEKLGRIFVEHPEEGNFIHEDYCKSPTMLNEFICGTNGRVGRFVEACTCLNGTCINQAQTGDSLIIRQKPLVATATTTTNEENLVLLAFSAHTSGPDDLLLTYPQFNALQGSLQDLHDYSLWVDIDGNEEIDRNVDLPLQRYLSTNSDTLLFDDIRGYGYVIPAGKTVYFEVRGTVRQVRSANVFQLGFTSENAVQSELREDGEPFDDITMHTTKSTVFTFPQN